LIIEMIEANAPDEPGMQLALRLPSLSFRVDLTGHCAEGGGSEVLMQVTRTLVREDPEVVGPTRQAAGQGAIWRRRTGPLSEHAQVIENLPQNLSALDDAELRRATRDRDERMSLLFRSWPSLSKLEMRELRKLNDERQRLARHVGIRRRLHALRAA
jgi:hypothetical protein